MSNQDQNISDQSGGVMDITELINPFPGLRPFGIEEGHLFFGREGQSDEVLVKLADNKFVAILGASGSGKSSFMYCGLVPSLVGGFMTEAGSNWRVVVARPGGGPIDNLAESLLLNDQEYMNLPEEDKLIKKTIIGTVLRSSSLGLVEVIKQLKTENDQNILVVIDQFEELFRFRKLESANSDMDESSAFVNLLLEAIHQFDEPIYVTITMRSDFIGECAKFPDLTQMINDSHYLIPQMTRDQKRAAVEGPVAVGGGIIAPRLTQQLLNDVGDNPDQLPILQHALMRTWTNWVDTRKEGEPMDLRHYNAIGTLREALSQHANEAYDALNKREKEICEVMFKALTERGSENQGIRRPTKLGTIASIAGVTEDEVIRVVDKFREPGRSLLMPPYGVSLESDTVVDISHESLMRIWDRLKRWLDEESKAAEMYIKLSEAAERFQEGKASLWKMPDLQLALNWREENNPTLVWGQRYNPAFERTIVFLETSEKAYETEQRNKELLQKRQVRRMRITAVAMGLAALVSIFFVVYANIKSNDAKRQAEIAKEKSILAQVKSDEAEKQAALAKKQEAEANKQSILAQENSLKAQQQAEIAEQQSALAKEQARIAQEQTDEAQKQQEIAQEQSLLAKKEQKKAEEAADRAEKLRMQSIAQSMAVKATSIPEAELKAIVAKQAYDYNVEFGDPTKPYNGDVYAGIYYGLTGVMEQERIIKDDSGRVVNTIILEGDSILNQFHGHIPQSGENEGKKIAVKSVLFSNDGTKMYSADADGKLFVWDYAGGQRKYREIFSQNQVNRVVNVSPNERFIALGTSGNNILVIDLKNLENEPIQVAGHEGGVIYDLVFLPDNTGFISAGADKKVLFNTVRGENSREVLVADHKPKSLAISPDSKRLAIGLDNGVVLNVDLTDPDAQPTQIVSFNTEGNKINTLSFSNNGKYLAIGEEAGVVNVWDLESKKRFGPQLVGTRNSGIKDVTFSPDDGLIVAASADRSARMWDMNNIYDLPTVFDDHEGIVWSVDFHPDGGKFVTASGDGIIRVFETVPDNYADQICGLVSENMSPTEWRQYVDATEEIEFVNTCPELKPGVDEAN